MAGIRRRLILPLALFVAVAVVAPAALAADHDLDPAFSGDGTAEFADVTGFANAVAIASDGGIYAGGAAINGLDIEWAVMRSTATGRLDTGFGDGGFNTLDFGSSDYLGAVDLVAQGNGVVVTGGADVNGEDGLALVRLTGAGQLDPAFGAGGKVLYRPDAVQPHAIALDPVSGKILVAGTNTKIGEHFFAFARFSSAGVPDPAFGTVPGSDGWTVEQIGTSGASGPWGLVVQPDQKPVGVGSTVGASEDFAVVRRTPAGLPDTTFSSDGETTIDFDASDGAFAVALQADGKIVVAGMEAPSMGHANFAVTRLNPDGSLDVDEATDGTPGAFGANGKVTVDFGVFAQARAVAVTSGGKILLVGQAPDKTALARLNSDGSLDSSFSGDGKLTPAEITGCLDISPYDMTLDGEGHAVIAGASGNFFGLARFGTPTPLVTPDCLPPDTSITSGPAAGSTTTDATPTFGLSSTEPSSTFECAVDSAEFAPCSGPGATHTTAALAPGPHALKVRSVDPGQNIDPTPATRSFTVASPPPDGDADGIPDSTDNCPADANATQKDTDSDHLGDVCDEDPSLPASCKLRKARSRVFVYTKKNKARLVVRYRTHGGAKVTTTYTALLKGGGKLQIGRVGKSFSAQGTFKLAKNLPKAKMTKVRAAKGFTVAFSIPGTPGSCARYYTKKLTKKRKVSGQRVWFQADSILTGF